MNIFEQYGIKEVADVCLYSIELDENDDEVYVPVLYLDTLKVSTVEQTASQTSARGGLGNPELIIWDYGKEITVTLEDALYNPASMGMTWGGKYGSKTYTVYGRININDKNLKQVSGKLKIKNLKNFEYDHTTKMATWLCSVTVISNDGKERYGNKNIKIAYNNKTKEFGFLNDMNNFTNTVIINDKIKTISFTYIKYMNTNSVSIQELVYEIDHALKNVYYLDRIEKCKATQTFVIDTDTNTRHGNYRYIEKYKNNELTVFIDPRTMQPYEPNTDEFVRKNGDKIYGNLRVIKQHEIYYKWTRSKATDNTSLGHQIVVDATHFPGTYRLVGETYSRSRKTGKDERFQFEIPLCKMGSENNFTLQAEGDPTTFTMTLKVLRREDGVMMKLTQYDVEEAKYDGYRSGSTNVVPEDAIDDNTDDREFNEKITYKKVKYGESYEENRKYDIEIIYYKLDTDNNKEGYYFYDKSALEVGDIIAHLSNNEKDKFRLRLKETWNIVHPYAQKVYINDKETDEFLLDEKGNILITKEVEEHSRYYNDNSYDPENGIYGCQFTLEPIG